MPEPSTRGELKPPKSGGKSISTSTATAKGEYGPRHRCRRIISRLKKLLNSASLKFPRRSTRNALPTPEKGRDDEQVRYASFTDLAIGKKPEATFNARCGPSESEASHSSRSRDENDFSGIGRDCESVVPIAELWNDAFEQLRKKDPKLIEKYEAMITMEVATMDSTTEAISGLGKVQRKEQMQTLVNQKLEGDEEGKWKFQLGDDRIAIRDVVEHIVNIVDWGKEFVGTALEASSYGSIAWAGMCLVLPVSIFSVVWGYALFALP